MPFNLSLAIRFGGQPLPDVPLIVTSDTTIAALKHRIRSRIPQSYADHAIKLIYNGRQLRNQVTVGKELGVAGGGVADGKKVWYVHCALPLAKDQSWEHDDAKRVFGDPTVTGAGDFDYESPGRVLPQQSSAASGRPESVAGPSPASSSARGFDRLRSIQSFTPTDITSMRTQFRANISARHTPTTMPSEEQMLRMEERWLDSSAFSSSLAAAAPSAAGIAPIHVAGEDTSTNAPANITADTAPDLIAARQLLAPATTELEAEDDASRALDDTLLGVVTGFFWPIGAVVWGLREDGVWSRRRGWSVLAGVMVNLCFGIVRIMG